MHSTLNLQAIATKELNSHLEEQAESIASSSLEKLPPELRGVFVEAGQYFLDVSQMLLEQALNMGRGLQEKKRLHNKRQRKYEYQIYLGQIGWTVIKANKYIKLVQTFGDIGAARLREIELNTLLTLCRSTYANVVEKMRSTESLSESIVQQWMKEERPKKSAIAPRPHHWMEGNAVWRRSLLRRLSPR